MPRIVRGRASRSRWWSSLIAGAALGVVGAWLVLRSGRDEVEVDPLSPRQPRDPGREPDLDAMTTRLRRVAGAEGLRLRSLGGGILELVGSASDDLDVSALLAALAAEPRVTVVVNRVWTPGSMDLAADLDAPSQRASPGDPPSSLPRIP